MQTNSPTGDAGTRPQDPSGQQSTAALRTRPAVPAKVTCPVCSTTFAPRATSGKCPVCGEQVVPQEALASSVPVVGPAIQWLVPRSGWRLSAVLVFVAYQIILFIVLWVYLATHHLL